MIDNKEFEYFKYVSGKENLSHIFDYELNTFESVSKPKVTGNISLHDLLTQIRYNFLNGMSIDEYLTPKYVNGDPNDAFKKIKEKKGTVCYNATFNGYKDDKNLKAPTNLMFLDLDHFKSKDEALAYKEMIVSKYDWIVACNLSFSRLGLHIIILVDKIIDKYDFNRKYDFISTVYFGSKLDKNAKSLTRHAIISSDSNIYINDNPNVLSIDSIISEINTLGLSVNDIPIIKTASTNNKSTRGGIKRGEVIPTACTFSPAIELKEITNIAARVDGLCFEELIDESEFTDPNIPLHFPVGVDVIEINLHPYTKQKVREGNRNSTIGGISMRLIYLSTNHCLDKPDNKKKNDIIRYMKSLNTKICLPPLTDQEVVNSVTSNWNKYVAGKLDVSKLFVKKRFFWSKRSTFKGKEKTSVTFKILNEPIVMESRQKIKDAIKEVYYAQEKITQKSVAEAAKMHLQTVKKYWTEYKSLVNELNLKLKYTTNSNVS
jgi:hypothetical protein